MEAGDVRPGSSSEGAIASNIGSTVELRESRLRMLRGLRGNAGRGSTPFRADISLSASKHIWVVT
ncbi:MAG: hypothetical protein JO168_13745 [Solirubrobacterales bacterium]|nr:hypothetical protein [Solirubrobacterales bacterium]